VKPTKSRVTKGIVALTILFSAVAHAQDSAAARDLFVTAGKSLVVDSPVIIQRVAVANPALAEALAVTPREVLVNGLAPGETSLIIWQQGGNRLIFDLNVRSNTTALEAVRRELAKELVGQEVSITIENNTVFLRGTVKDLVCAERAVSITSTLGKTVNLLQVAVPPTDPQVLLKVRFANVDRAASTELGANIISTGAGGMIGAVSTGQFPAPAVSATGGAATFSLADALNVFLFRPDLNLAVTIKALENKRLLELLAEPSVPAIDGKTASFLAGGEFPFPVIQGGAAVGSVTIQFREFGVRITFTPRMTPRGTLRLQVAPEVSSLDFANGLVFQGFNIPALSTRKVQTEIELESGQSFGIAGLLDNRVVETWSKVPGLGDIPFFGNLFRSKSRSKNNTELLVLVTPELVRPVPVGQPAPELKMPLPFLEGTSAQAPRTPGMDVTGPVPVRPAKETIPFEELMRSLRPSEASEAPAFTPGPATPGLPAAQPAPAAPAQAAPARATAAGL
jgi:pilus assembly protein CpaC